MRQTKPNVKMIYTGTLVVLIATTAAASQNAGLGISKVCTRSSFPTGLPSGGPHVPPIIKGAEYDSHTPQANFVLPIVYGFETGGAYDKVTPNFDGKGLSLGIMQFNFGGAAQDAFRSIDPSVFDATMPIWGKTFYSAVHSASSPEAIKIVTKMQDEVPYIRNGKSQNKKVWVVKPDASLELRAFLSTTESRAAQNTAAQEFYSKGYARAEQWSKARGEATPTIREVAWFVDNQVFSNGDMGGMWLQEATAFRQSFPDDGTMVDFVSTWLASCPDTGSGSMYDADVGKQDASDWRKKVPVGTALPDEQALLFSLGFLKALAAHGPNATDAGIFKSQVMQRRGVIALGIGVANGIRWPANEPPTVASDARPVRSAKSQPH